MSLPTPAVLRPWERLNGRLPDDVLTSIGHGRLAHPAARSWLAMVEHARRDGIDLRPTSNVDAYRPLAVQIATFERRYRPIGNGWRPGARKWRDQWWLLIPGNAAAATPGTSNHGLGLAIDYARTGDHATVQRRDRWVRAWAAHYGWATDRVPNEPWHIEYVAGDTTPPFAAATDDQEDDDMAITDVAVACDAEGNGWTVVTTVPFMQARSVAPIVSPPATAGYQQPIARLFVADGGATGVSVTGWVPRGAVTVRVAHA